MPQVKELKRIDVAGSATEQTKTKEFFLQWHLTERCNLACSHCYQDGKATGETGCSDVREVAAEVADMVESWTERYGISFSPSFHVTGGEPLLVPDLTGMLRLLRHYRFQVYLLTNGTLVDRERAKGLAGLVDGVQVSIEGPEQVHDTIRGKGAFRKAALGIERLRAEGIHVDLNATLSTLNADFVDDLISLAIDLGVSRIGFSRLVPYGRGGELISRMLSADRVSAVYGHLLGVTDPRIEIVTGDPIAAPTTVAGDAGDLPCGGCAAGISGITLLPDGTLTPCRRLPLPIGNVRTDSIREVWARSPVLGVLRDRSRYKGKCGACSRWATCRGCRAIAYAWARSRGKEDFLGDDPQCFCTPVDSLS